MGGIQICFSLGCAARDSKTTAYPFVSVILAEKVPISKDCLKEKQQQQQQQFSDLPRFFSCFQEKHPKGIDI